MRCPRNLGQREVPPHPDQAVEALLPRPVQACGAPGTPNDEGEARETGKDRRRPHFVGEARPSSQARAILPMRLCADGLFAKPKQLEWHVASPIAGTFACWRPLDDQADWACELWLVAGYSRHDLRHTFAD